jgi:hypothetical protein
VGHQWPIAARRSPRPGGSATRGRARQQPALPIDTSGVVDASELCHGVLQRQRREAEPDATERQLALLGEPLGGEQVESFTRPPQQVPAQCAKMRRMFGVDVSLRGQPLLVAAVLSATLAVRVSTAVVTGCRAHSFCSGTKWRPFARCTRMASPYSSPSPLLCFLLCLQLRFICASTASGCRLPRRSPSAQIATWAFSGSVWGKTWGVRARSPELLAYSAS